jgi:Ca2+-transporting ATPase
LEEILWHSVDFKTALEALNTSTFGLSEEEAKLRLEKYGPNELKEEKRVTPIELFIRQFKSILVVILVLSAVVSAFISARRGEAYTDAYVIFIIVIMNALLGFYQEYRAEKAVEALKRMIAPQVIALRNGREQSIESKNLVPGDIILLEAGSRVPADGRLLEAANMKVDEAALTGESTSVTKLIDILPPEVTVADRRNLIFMGTIVTGGRAVAVITTTGMSTEFGKIAGMVQAVEEEDPPLKKKVELMGRQLGTIAVILCIWVFIIGVFIHNQDLEIMFMTAISLAVSAIPEGLPAVLTITLALGVSRMARQKSIVRKLASVETLGSTTVICSDKTGTLTRNEMTVKRIISNGRVIDVTGVGYSPDGEFLIGQNQINPKNDCDMDLLLRIGALCNDASLHKNSDGWVIFGDPTEGALIVASAKAGIPNEELKKKYSRIGEIPFDSIRKRMSTIHTTPEGLNVVYVKGAPEIILERSTSIYKDGAISPLTQEDMERELSNMKVLAGDALRVLAVAYKELPKTIKQFEEEEVETELTYRHGDW